MAETLSLCLCGEPPSSHGINGCACVGCGCTTFRPRVQCLSLSAPLSNGHRVACQFVEPHEQHANAGFTWDDEDEWGPDSAAELLERGPR